MRRRAGRVLLVLALGTLPILIALVTVLIRTGSGRALLARVVAAELGRTLRGQFEIGAIHGSFIRDLTLERVTVRDTSGALLASLPRAEIRFGFQSLLVGRVVLSKVTLDHPTIHITKHPSGRLNFQEVLKLGEGPPGTGPSPLIEFRNLSVDDGALRISLPWSPPNDARTQAEREAALTADRAQPGRVIEESPEGLQRIISLDPLTVRFRRVLISSPDHQPLTFDIDSIATRVSDPAVTVTSGVIRGWTHEDSLALSITRATLPNTLVRGGGVVTWPHGPLQYDLALAAPRIDLDDLRWVSPDFPSLSGRSLVGLQSASDSLTAYTLRDLRLSGAAGSAEGRVTLLTNQARGLGVRGMQLTLTDLDLEAVRPYLDTLPFQGSVSGTLAGGGYFDSMMVDLDWMFREGRLEDHPLNHIALNGHLVLNGPQGLEFRHTELREADVDLRSARLLIPAVILEGRMQGSGTLNGPLQLISFEGTAQHEDGDRPVSVASGAVTFDSRGKTLGLASDLTFDPLDFDGIRRAFPSLKSRGRLSGRVHTSGFLDRLAIDADLHGELGSFHARGRGTLLPPRWGADDMAIDFRDLDLEALRGEDPHTRLQGSLRATGVIDTLVAPKGRLTVELGPGWVRELAFDTAWTIVSMADSLIQLDTLDMTWMAGGLGGAGTLGWSSGHDGGMQFNARLDSLGVLDSFALVMSGLPRDTTAGSRRLSGRGDGALRLGGSLDSLSARMEAEVRDASWQQARTAVLDGRLEWSGGRRPRLAASVASDSVSAGHWVARNAGFEVEGYADSLDWRTSLGLGDAVVLRGGGYWWRREDARLYHLDSLTVNLPNHRWHLTHPTSVLVADTAFSVEPVTLDADDGSGAIGVGGTVPRRRAGDFAIHVLGLPLQDLYLLGQRDTTGVSGRVGVDLAVGGSFDAPTFTGTASLADARFEDFNAPFIQGVVNYADRSLEANLLVWRTGQPVLRVQGQLPVDLALKSVPERRLKAPLLIRGTADSTDLGVIEAFTPTVRGVRGVLNAALELGGTWDAPRLSGYLSLSDAALTLPALGARYTGISGRARLSGDSIQLDTLRLNSGQGTMRVTGGLRLEELTRPVLDLRFRASQFYAVNIRNLLSLEASGDLALRGPFIGATLTGDLTANTGALHFADLITKRIVDLEATPDSELIDQSQIRRQRLGVGISNKFLEALIIQDLRLSMGESFWLRSNEANIQLDGSLTVNKVRQNYRLYGTLTALRGNYALKVGFVTRNFTVERGDVRYFGTPDLNADLDIEARHTVRTVPDNEEIPVIATVSGTLLAPKLTLTSDQHPPLSETELVSYLMFGQPSFGLASGNSAQGANQLAAVNSAVSYLSSALSNEIQRTLTTDLGVPIDYIEIKPGQLSPSQTNQTGVASVAQVAAGWQIGRKWFVAVNADVCTNRTQLYPNAEYRISKEFRLKATVEPSLYCTDINPSLQSNVNRYQVGFDVLWQREW